MNNLPTLYIGIAAPLVEAARVWVAEIPPYQNEKERREKLKQFPHANIGAYGLSFPDLSVIAFRAGLCVNKDRVQAEVGQWSGKLPELLPKNVVEMVPTLNYRKGLESVGDVFMRFHKGAPY